MQVLHVSRGECGTSPVEVFLLLLDNMSKRYYNINDLNCTLSHKAVKGKVVVCLKFLQSKSEKPYAKNC